jgi:Fe-S-cluster containining protein
MARECGDCQLCCELIGVEELGKHPHNVCQYQCDTGCSIHNARPRECRTYQCQWRSDEDVPEELRPDKLGCIVDVHETPLGLAIVVHQRYPNQWQEPHIAELLGRLAKHNEAWIYALYGNDRQAIFPEWSKKQQEKFDVMAESGTVQELYGKIAHPDE